MAEASEERDFVIARAFVARSAAASAVESLDDVLLNFRDPSEDPKGEERQAALQDVIDQLDQSYVAANAALKTFEQVDPSEGEPDLSFLEDDDDEDEDEDGEEEEAAA